MHRIGRGWDEIKLLIVVPGLLILRKYRERANAGNVGRLNGSLHRVPQKSFPDALALPSCIHREARKQHDWYRVARQALSKSFGSFFVGHLSDGERMVADKRLSRCRA
jgi:hypothetical protein